jgi:hypothetical protein
MGLLLVIKIKKSIFLFVAQLTSSYRVHHGSCRRPSPLAQEFATLEPNVLEATPFWRPAPLVQEPIA